MIRSSSFFWASDEHRNNHGGDGEADNLFVGDDAASSNGFYNGGFLDVGNGGTNDDDDEKSRYTLVKDQTNGYDSIGASASLDTVSPTRPERRILFQGKEKFEQGVKYIRFQVVIWNVGTIDVQQGQVKMKFRLTLYWNDDERHDHSSTNGHNLPHSRSYHTMWEMEGRKHACRKDLIDHMVKEMIDVPPVSILNAVDFDIIGTPEVSMINEETRLMRWTGMYNAILTQGDHLSVENFPHDSHKLKLKLGILADRGKGRKWDHNIYKLDLASEEDSQGSSRIPHGLIVDHARVPDFSFDASDLGFEFFSLGYSKMDDQYLQVTLPVVRQSGQFDHSIFPILIVLNIIAVSCLPRNFDSPTASTETMLSIAFVQVGIRLTVDSKLPSVGYKIKMQHVMNQCFWLLCGLVLESNVAFFLVRKCGVEENTDALDACTAVVALLYNFYIARTYLRNRPAQCSRTA